MERFIRSVIDKLGGGIGKGSTKLSVESLVADVYQTVERNLKEDQQGVRRLAPSTITVALSYELHSRLKEEILEEIRQELRAAVESYIRDHRYSLPSPLTVDLTCDPFLRRPIEFRVTHEPSPAHADALWLVSEEGRTFELDFGEPQNPRRLTIGRSGDNDVMIDHPTVSRFHASMTLNQQGEIIVSDVGSANGTFINGQRVGAWQRLRPNDELKVGSVALELRRG